ncbi:MAG TPA: methylmalonyl Co-A mutase-associated GTPase MeaB, partial [Daejeonella sp.]
KSGLMEIADIFVVNKSDREGADTFANNLKKLVHQRVQPIPVINTVADKSIGISELIEAIENQSIKENKKRIFLLAEKAWKLLQHQKMKNFDKKQLQQDIVKASANPDFNLYRFIDTLLIEPKNS